MLSVEANLYNIHNNQSSQARQWFPSSNMNSNWTSHTLNQKRAKHVSFTNMFYRNNLMKYWKKILKLEHRTSMNEETTLKINININICKLKSNPQKEGKQISPIRPNQVKRTLLMMQTNKKDQRCIQALWKILKIRVCCRTRDSYFFGRRISRVNYRGKESLRERRERLIAKTKSNPIIFSKDKEKTN